MYDLFLKLGLSETEHGCIVEHINVLVLQNYPTINGGMQNESSVGICTHCTHVFRTFGTDLHAQLVLSDKISAFGTQSDVC